VKKEHREKRDAKGKTVTNGEGMYKREREDQIKGGGRKRVPTASRTICPGWQRGKWWELNEVGREILWTATM